MCVKISQGYVILDDFNAFDYSSTGTRCIKQGYPPAGMCNLSRF